ncbi:amidohydrolase family protein [Paenibacillus antibioticophila]|uniref:amidohydrolase family protein n=1 Tax=Paenibacillus antibioticophila TaxID=1274374 RepID=UPI000A58F4D9|nr:amidohydrolase family protein [Paenibacillus antibioticophila]
MTKRSMVYMLVTVVIILMVTFSLWKKMDELSENRPVTTTSSPTDSSLTTSETAATDAESDSTETEVKSLYELVAEYGDLQLVDAHNHDASGFAYYKMQRNWEHSSVDRIVLFGDVSEPSAIKTDEIAWGAYQEAPERFIPFFSGINLLDESGLQTVRDNLEKGYFGIGEIAAASTYSPALAHVAWKTKDPMDGILPDIYKLCAEYKVPVLLHIDPPNGAPVFKLEEALEAYPDTTFIFAHINAHNSPDNVESLLEKHPNLYADFFAGFTAFNPESAYELEDFVPVIKKFPDRFLLSTDSGYGLSGGEEKAIEGMYRLMDALDDRQIAQQVAGGNLEELIRIQPATDTQLEALRNLPDMDRDLTNLTKEEAGKLLSNNKK